MKIRCLIIDKSGTLEYIWGKELSNGYDKV